MILALLFLKTAFEPKIEKRDYKLTGGLLKNETADVSLTRTWDEEKSTVTYEWKSVWEDKTSKLETLVYSSLGKPISYSVVDEAAGKKRQSRWKLEGESLAIHRELENGTSQDTHVDIDPATIDDPSVMWLVTKTPSVGETVNSVVRDMGPARSCQSIYFGKKDVDIEGLKGSFHLVVRIYDRLSPVTTYLDDAGMPVRQEHVNAETQKVFKLLTLVKKG